MAAIDTIEILDGLDHEQDITTSIIYDIDSATAEAVGTYAVAIPVTAKQVRVLFNNNYDPNGSSVHVRVRLTKVTSNTTPTKTENTEPLAWFEIAGNAGDDTMFKETGSIDVSASFETTLHIDCALSSTTAHTGTEIIVQISSEAGVDGSWTDVARFIGPTGTAISNAFAATEPAGETVIAIANPVANNLDNVGKFKFVENTVVADSEIIYQTEVGADA
ncbi:hypothetical protein LCGC14_0434370 [marine sediment metagenome]|uniref:Uncharacterized protein n=1 Tax=marine sediment metagenome TaxID=412755 RepID=A0A0F9T5A7_9ZZZZ